MTRNLRSPAFAQGIERLLTLAAAARITVMCAEAARFRCHRALLADALRRPRPRRAAYSVDARARPHQLCDFARTDGICITYV